MNVSAGDAATDRVTALPAFWPVLSCTRIVTGKVPAAVGVPASSPVEGFRVNPAGRVPVEDQVNGPVPPVTTSASVYAAPTCPPGGAGKDNDGDGVTAMLRFCVAVCALASVTWTVNGKEPAAVGLPDSSPVAELRVTPPGSDPEVIDQLNGAVPVPLWTANWSL